MAVVAVPGSTDPEVVAFLDTLGLRPGVQVEVREKHPFDGPLVLVVDGRTAPWASGSPARSTSPVTSPFHHLPT